MIHQAFQCEFYFIRHGQSSSNASPEFAANINFDTPLTDLGYAQARLLGERFKRDNVHFDRVYCSTLQRAIQTTETMLQAMGKSDGMFTQVDAIVEQRIPGWRGLLLTEVYTPEMVAYMRGKGSHFVPSDGESYRMVQRRVANWLEDEILYNAELVSEPQDLKIAIVGHGGASRCLFHYIMGFDERFLWRIALDNTSISRFRFSKEGWRLICINDSAHLTHSPCRGESGITTRG